MRAFAVRCSRRGSRFAVAFAPQLLASVWDVQGTTKSNRIETPAPHEDASRSARTPSIRHAVDANKTQSISLPSPPHRRQHALVAKSTLDGARDAVERGGEPRDDRVLVRRRVGRREDDDAGARRVDAARLEAPVIAAVGWSSALRSHASLVLFVCIRFMRTTLFPRPDASCEARATAVRRTEPATLKCA